MTKSFEDLTPEERSLIDLLGAVAVGELEKAAKIMEERPADEDYTPYNYQRINHHFMMAMMARVTVLTVLTYPGNVTLGGEQMSPFGNLPPKGGD